MTHSPEPVGAESVKEVMGVGREPGALLVLNSLYFKHLTRNTPKKKGLEIALGIILM